METLTDPIVLRAIERYLIIIGAIVFAVLGYRLFMNGIKSGSSELRAKGKGFELIFSGKAPGLFFMLCAATVFFMALATGVTHRSSSEERRSNNMDEWIDPSAELERLKSIPDDQLDCNFTSSELVIISRLEETSYRNSPVESPYIYRKKRCEEIASSH